MKVVLNFDLGEAFVNDLKSIFPDVDFRPVYTSEEELREVVDAEVQFGLISQDAFAAAKKLRWFHFIGMGFDGYKINFPKMFDGEFIFTRAPGTHVIPMAEHTFAMILAYAHRIPDFIADQKAHCWNTENYMDKIIEFIQDNINFLNNIQSYHWQTRSYSEHETLTEYHEKFNRLNDEFVVAWQGKTGQRVNFSAELRPGIMNYADNPQVAGDVQKHAQYIIEFSKIPDFFKKKKVDVLELPKKPLKK